MCESDIYYVVHFWGSLNDEVMSSSNVVAQDEWAERFDNELFQSLDDGLQLKFKGGEAGAADGDLDVFHETTDEDAAMRLMVAGMDMLSGRPGVAAFVSLVEKKSDSIEETIVQVGHDQDWKQHHPENWS